MSHTIQRDAQGRLVLPEDVPVTVVAPHKANSRLHWGKSHEEERVLRPARGTHGQVEAAALARSQSKATRSENRTYTDEETAAYLARKEKKQRRRWVSRKGTLEFSFRAEAPARNPKHKNRVRWWRTEREARTWEQQCQHRSQQGPDGLQGTRRAQGAVDPTRTEGQTVKPNG